MTETSCDTKRTVTCAVLPRSSAPMMSALSIETNRVSTVSPLLALADRGLEAVIDLARQQILERAAVAFGIGGDDHLVGGARAGDEMLGVEGLVLAGDGVEPGGERRARLGDALPALGRLGASGRLRRAVSAPRPGSVTTLSLVAPRTASRAE